MIKDTLIIRIEPELKEKLTIKARENHEVPSQIVRKLIREYISESNWKDELIKYISK